MQNHLLQVMAVLAMDRPVSLDPEDIRDAKLKVLRQVTRVDPAKDVVAGQYVASDGKPGYRDNASVADGSRTPTYAMVVLNVRNERWDGVPFILKAGKALNEKRSEIRIQLRSTPGDIFAEDDGQSSGREGPDGADLGAGPNEFVLRIQPHEEMYMKLTIKEPGLGVQPVPSEMELSGRWRAEQERKEVAGRRPGGVRASHPRRGQRPSGAFRARRRARGGVGDRRPDQRRDRVGGDSNARVRVRHARTRSRGRTSEEHGTRGVAGAEGRRGVILVGRSSGRQGGRDAHEKRGEGYPREFGVGEGRG